jgi:hypothetical protein
MSGAIMTHEAPLKHVSYLVATPEKAWEGFVAPDRIRRLAEKMASRC